MVTLPNIETTRLRLGNLAASDIPRIIAFAGEKEIEEMTLNIPHPYHESDAIRWISMANEGLKNQNAYNFALRTKEDGLFIGGMGIHINALFDRAELGYWIAKPYWNQGYATEALAAILKFGFEKLNLNKIFATHLIDNPASGKVMIKNHMIKEGELVEHYKKGEIYKSVSQYRLTRKEYNRMKDEL